MARLLNVVEQWQRLSRVLLCCSASRGEKGREGTPHELRGVWVAVEGFYGDGDHTHIYEYLRCVSSSSSSSTYYS